MRTDFVGHATLLVQVGELKLLSDPWWAGPAYRGQWYPYPLPVPVMPEVLDGTERGGRILSVVRTEAVSRPAIALLLT